MNLQPIDHSNIPERWQSGSVSGKKTPEPSEATTAEKSGADGHIVTTQKQIQTLKQLTGAELGNREQKIAAARELLQSGRINDPDIAQKTAHNMLKKNELDFQE